MTHKIPENVSHSNIASFLPDIASRQPYRPAVLFPSGRARNGRVKYTHYTFQQLERESNQLAYGLHQIGIKDGVRTVLMVKPSLEFFALTFALFKVGAVPVLVDPGMGVKNLGQCLAESGPEAFIGIPKAHIARQFFGWARKTVRILVTVGRRLTWRGPTLRDLRELGSNRSAAMMFEPKPGEMAAILFTSGSTGVPKGAVYTHEIFVSQVNMLRNEFAIELGEIDLATFPLFALFAPALGMTAVIPDMDASRPAKADPRKIIEAIEDFGVTNLFASPALLNNLSSYGENHRISLPSLRRVISAGAAVPAHVIERCTTMLANGVQVFTPYGATEALPVAAIGSDEILAETARKTNDGAGVCVGRTLNGMDVRIIGIDDEPIDVWKDDLELKQGDIGEIVVKGPAVTNQYYNRPASTKLAKISDVSGGGLWHRMGDVGCFDGTGRLWVFGRKSHRVETVNGTMFTLPCEAIFNTHRLVSRSALVGVGEPGSQEPVLCVELMEKTGAPADDEDVRRELLELGRQFETTQSIKTVLFHPSLPVDVRHNSKIFREKLAEWASRRLS